MYRARVQAVSGSKVFADGKWLKCIGNKPVSVGERVWTDGRVVYGHYTIPQTPLISISKDEDTIIPIVTTKNFYVFDKGKLKIVTPTGITLPTFDKLFIYHKRARAYFVDDNYLFNPAEYVYSETDNWGFRFESKKTWTLKGILAANVDKGGNLFGIILDGENLLIRKNDQIVKEFNLHNMGEEVLSTVTQPSNPPLPAGDKLWTHGGGIHINIYHSFIENENNFTVFICFDAYKTSEGGVVYYRINENDVTRHYYISNNGIVADEDISISYNDDGVYVVNTEFNPDKKNPLYDGYYFKRQLYERQISTTTYTTYEKKTVYAPNDSEIFTGLFPLYSNIIFSKVKGGYLMAVNVDDYSFPINSNGNLRTILNLPYFLNGIFLLHSGKWEMLTEDFTTEKYLNQNLRPMKKNKNWPKRIEEISFD